MNKFVLIVFGLLLLSGVANARSQRNNINSCQTISTPGIYYLTQDVSNDKVCFTIKSDNVVLDCRGHSITGASQYWSKGILNEGNSVTINDCVFAGYTYGVLNVAPVNYQVIKNNVFEHSVTFGIQVKGSNHDIYGNEIHSPAGIYSPSLSNSKIRDNFMDGDNIKGKSPVSAGVLLEGASSYNEITGNQITRYHEGIAFECPGICKNNQIKNNNIYNNGNNGIILIFMKGTVIENNKIVDTGLGAGIQIYDAENSLIKNNKLKNRRNLWVKAESSNNVIYGNSFYTGTSYHIWNLGQNNVFSNYVRGVAQGNYYDDINAVSIYDTNNDGFGDSGSAYPYDDGESKWQGNGFDFGPIGARQINTRVNQ